ncbi:hypothetical protein KRE40_06835 [Elizabethkingia meningoseptica]|uniref:DUF6326 family protein n=1 Tax=Elizabethkingia meningoseptica TaxID=238 RepID=UPI000999CB36|nr:DUF6326 family protein [Elizabethkingia meningoseptica]MDE5436437.1 hypothetical protein [Elizabethkingia meningoseptica]MDE5449437.1 hypothetical protein [Elizabethkingia meningoseptica]MDE5508363.1 hypothetical protein [Elizabethkingia meningoseptica]MDE5515053.1 hypothetical protein [Elizabethkingia meningoseptica]MDE5525789.1 hypothetical protein [Elizabethkingia meningoseptica]
MDSKSKNSDILEDFKINTKIRLSFLWTAVTLCYLYGDYFELYIPGKVKGLLDNTNLLDNPQKLLTASFVLAIPAVMVFLSVILKAKINRLLNIILGLIYTGIMLLIAVTSLTHWRMFYVFLALLESLITSMIVYYAWTWPKKI